MHDEVNDIAAAIATPAIPILFSGVDRKGTDAEREFVDNRDCL
jgi:hypothetical protein